MQADDGSAPGTFHNFRAVMQARATAQQRGLHHSLRHLLEIIAGYTNGSPAWPSYETLAGITGLSAERVRHYVKALVDQGYLTRTRRPRPSGGWGQPEWALGQVVTGDHSPAQVEVVTGDQSSGHGRPLASGHGRPQKNPWSQDQRELPLVALMEGGVEEKREEKDPPTPQPAKPKPAKMQRIADVIDAITGAGVKAPQVAPRDAFAVNGCDAPAGEIAECFVAMARGDWPERPQDRAFARSNLSLRYAVDRLTAYQQRSATSGATLNSLLD